MDSVENSALPDKTTAAPVRKKKNFRFLRFLLTLILLLVLAFVLWAGICWLDKMPLRRAIPSGYCAFIHVDSAFETFDPLLDLEAADAVLSSPEYAALGSLVDALKKSGLREKKSFEKLASRKTDVALYVTDEGKIEFVAAIDTGPFAFLARAMPLLLPHAKNGFLSELEYIKEEGLSYFKTGGSGLELYIKNCKNLIVASGSMERFLSALDMEGEEEYSEDERLCYGEAGLLRMIASPRVIFRSGTGSNVFMREIDSMLRKDGMTPVSIEADGDEIRAEFSLPLELSESQSPLRPLLEHQATEPEFGRELGGYVRGYTLINAGSLSELKDAVFPLFPAEMNADRLWQDVQRMCRAMFRMSLDDMFFSWTGDELAVIRLEGLDSPVLALEIGNEDERSRVFSRLASSFFVKDSSAMILNGQKLNLIELSGAMRSLLSLFKITFPSAYYFMRDGFIYFSESATALSHVHMGPDPDAGSDGERLLRRMEESGMAPSFRMYFDAAEGKPFFADGNSALSGILSVYSRGMCDISVQDSALCVTIWAFF